WVRFALTNPEPTPQFRWLRQQWVFQQSVVLFLRAPDGSTTRLANGAEVPLQDRPVRSRLLLFPVALEPGETREFYLRLSGRSATVAKFDLWRPEALLDEDGSETLVEFLASGGCLVVAACGIIAWHLRRRAFMLAVGAGHLMVIAVVILLDGYGAYRLPLDATLWQARALFSAAFLGLFFHAIFARGFLELPRRFPPMARLMTGISGICLAMSVLVLVAFDPRATAVVAVMALATMSAVAIRATPGGGATARAYLGAWGLLVGAVMLRALLLLGETPQLPNGNLLPLLGFVASVAVLTYALNLDIKAVRDAIRDAERQRLADQEGDKERLAAAVAEQTRELREAMAKAEEASSAKSTFLSIVSHELRTPLHTILGYAHLLRRQSAPDAQEKLAIIEHGGEQLLRLIDQVLEFTRGGQQTEELDPEPCSIAALADDLENTGRILARTRGNRFVLARGPGLPTAIEADAPRLTQVLQNLIGNACKYTGNGEILLRLDRATDTPPDPARPRTSRLRFVVEDTGCGIAPADLERIFDPFTRVAGRQRQPGLGLGLAIARRLVRAMGGEITVASTPGRGSRFEFAVEFPVLAEGPATTPHVPGEGRPIVGHRPPRRRILIADDIAENRIFLRELCQRWGFAVAEARDGAEAWAQCLDVPTPFDLVLADQFMPVVDGWDLLRSIRGNAGFGRTAVVLVSAAPPTLPDGFPEGIRFDDVLLKPFPQERLETALMAILGVEWIRAGDADAGNEMPPVLPPAEKLAEFRSMVDLGRIVALRNWCGELRRQSPEYAEFADTIERLARQVDLPGLREAADRLS
ncbi:MAG: response regulator, partial [Rhodocyclaceae bacterium]|nr:response regulator [Rhodocyclaceae bacterium]